MGISNLGLRIANLKGKGEQTPTSVIASPADQTWAWQSQIVSKQSARPTAVAVWGIAAFATLARNDDDSEIPNSQISTVFVQTNKSAIRISKSQILQYWR